MKYVNNKLVSFLLLSVFLMSCQREEFNINDGGDEEIPVELSKMVMKIVTHDGSFDDVVDGGNCFSIDIPYTIKVNEEELVVASVNEYANLAQSDQIDIVFPITVTTHEHKKIELTNGEALQALAASCEVDDEDIECVDFVYPFIFQTFDESTNRFQTIEVAHDQQIFEFMSNLNSTTKVSIKYPIDLTLYNGENTIAGHNEALMQTILEVIDVCDENDG